MEAYQKMYAVDSEIIGLHNGSVFAKTPKDALQKCLDACNFTDVKIEPYKDSDGYKKNIAVVYLLGGTRESASYYKIVRK